MNISNIYKSVWKSIIFSYYLSRKESCSTYRIFEVVNDKLKYNDLNNKEVLFSKNELFNLLESEGFTISEYTYENGVLGVLFSISKNEVKNSLIDDKIKKKGF